MCRPMLADFNFQVYLLCRWPWFRSGEVRRQGGGGACLGRPERSIDTRVARTAIDARAAIDGDGAFARRVRAHVSACHARGDCKVRLPTRRYEEIWGALRRLTQAIGRGWELPATSHHNPQTQRASPRQALVHFVIPSSAIVALFLYIACARCPQRMHRVPSSSQLPARPLHTRPRPRPQPEPASPWPPPNS